jgi:NAD(P)-dependent dehydrogenase (short-subunit alcohol dehydrogenase family)
VTGGSEPVGSGSKVLQTKVAVVTGASAGLGLGIAERFAAEGAEVFGLDINPAPDGVHRGFHSGLHHLQVDVGDRDQVEAAIESVLDRAGHIDVLVCNAAIMQERVSVTQTDDETLRRVMRVNFDGVFYPCRAVGRHMTAMRRGRIITVSSQVAAAPWPGMAVYAASKAAVIAFTRAFALEVVGSGVYVNCILPGTMDTDQMRQSFAGVAHATGVDVEELIDVKRRSMPLGRLGTPTDAANLATWLASDQASFSVGGLFDLTGGELWSRTG